MRSDSLPYDRFCNGDAARAKKRGESWQLAVEYFGFPLLVQRFPRLCLTEHRPDSL